MNYLPFARPTIDEETIAGVAEVLRSGWITTGPKVQEFEQALSEYLGGRTCAPSPRPPARWKWRCRLRHRPRRRGDRAGHDLRGQRQRGGARRRQAGVRGRRAQSRAISIPTRLEAAITPRTRAIMPVHFAGLAVDMDASTPSPSGTAARDRGCGPCHRHALERASASAASAISCRSASIPTRT